MPPPPANPKLNNINNNSAAGAVLHTGYKHSTSPGSRNQENTGKKPSANHHSTNGFRLAFGPPFLCGQLIIKLRFRGRKARVMARHVARSRQTQSWPSLLLVEAEHGIPPGDDVEEPSNRVYETDCFIQCGSRSLATFHSRQRYAFVNRSIFDAFLKRRVESS
ncbi:hypothetical protein LY76DRAFT_31645 [Colletotrichum caudatum]|nr:hypothetical protein LY76DRAFT_31645 [Colletotrichum caudatum]